MNRLLKVIVFGLVAVLVIGGVAGITAYRFLYEPASESDEVAVFEVRPGDSFKSAAKRLEDAGLVVSADKLSLLARITSQSGKMRIGEYAIRRNMTPKEVLGIITSGRSIEYVVTIQEGFNRFEIADALERQKIVANKQEFLDLTQDKAFIKELLGEDLASLEGYLFPETYHVTKFTGARGLVKMMVDRFKAKFGELEADKAWNQKRMSRHELVTLASIIEKETGAPEERPVISSVFHNRLRLNMRLQTDPTVVYGIWEKTGQWNRNITRNDLLTPNRYNTYSFTGLPYGPIANAGFEALKYAGAPAQSEFLFFVSRNDGTHIFSKDYGQHQKAVVQYQLDRKAREGKSWRDLQKRDKVPEKVTDSLGEKKPAAAGAVRPSSKK